MRPVCPCSRIHARPNDSQSSGSRSIWTGHTPYENTRPWHTRRSSLTATTHTGGLKRASIRAVVPVRVGTNTASHGTVSSACSTTVAIASAADDGRCER